MIALQCARSAEERGIQVDFPCLLALAFVANSVWQYGLSSSAALLNLAAFSRAIQAGVQSTWQIMLLYRAYGAVAGLIQFTTVGTALSGFFAKVPTPLAFTLLPA